jgi:hypothetical protein
MSFESVTPRASQAQKGTGAFRTASAFFAPILFRLAQNYVAHVIEQSIGAGTESSEAKNRVDELDQGISNRSRDHEGSSPSRRAYRESLS